MHLKTEILSYLKSLYNAEGSFCFASENRVANLYSTCFAVRIIDLINGWSDFSENERNNITEFICSCYDSETALFNKLRPETSSSIDSEYVLQQLSSFAVDALQLLKADSPYKLSFISPYTTGEESVLEWLEALNWRNPWQAGNQVMFMLNILISEADNADTECLKTATEVINWLSSKQNPKTGFWDLGKGSTLHNQMAGAYHFMFFYTYLKMDASYWPQIVASTLKLQQSDGMFSYSGGGSPCEDLDAIDLLCRASFYTDHRQNDIKTSLKSVYKKLLECQTTDGGFISAHRSQFSVEKILSSVNPINLTRLPLKDCISSSRRKLKNQYQVLFCKDKIQWAFSGFPEMLIHYDQSDLFSTWFRLLAIATIEEVYPDIIGDEKSCDWKFRDKAWIGFLR